MDGLTALEKLINDYYYMEDLTLEELVEEMREQSDTMEDFRNEIYELLKHLNKAI